MDHIVFLKILNVVLNNKWTDKKTIVVSLNEYCFIRQECFCFVRHLLVILVFLIVMLVLLTVVFW